MLHCPDPTGQRFHLPPSYRLRIDSAKAASHLSPWSPWLHLYVTHWYATNICYGITPCSGAAIQRPVAIAKFVLSPWCIGYVFQGIESPLPTSTWHTWQETSRNTFEDCVIPQTFLGHKLFQVCRVQYLQLRRTYRNKCRNHNTSPTSIDHTAVVQYPLVPNSPSQTGASSDDVHYRLDIPYRSAIWTSKRETSASRRYPETSLGIKASARPLPWSARSCSISHSGIREVHS